MRQAWGQAALTSGWSFTGGQMWSLVTETRMGEDNRTEALPMTIDPQYTVGFSWARQYGFRVIKDWGNKVWLGFSVEDSEATLTAHGNTAGSFLLGGPGLSGGLYNGAVSGCSTTPSQSRRCRLRRLPPAPALANYSFNPSPDFIAKVAFQPGFGHYEIFGIGSGFRDRIFPDAGLTRRPPQPAHSIARPGRAAAASMLAGLSSRSTLTSACTPWRAKVWDGTEPPVCPM